MAVLLENRQMSLKESPEQGRIQQID